MTGGPSSTSSPGRRRRDAEHSRRRLLEAALELFSDRGFDRTTTREIGERAGVDAALIARYFGSKTKLYIAAMEARSATDGPVDALDPARLGELLGGPGRNAPGPVLRTAVLPQEDPAVQLAAREQLYQRLVTPLADRLAQEGLSDPQLQAEIAGAALAGIALGRHAGTLSALDAVPQDQLVELVHALLTRGLGTPPASHEATTPAPATTAEPRNPAHG
ncbi:helix-turn-helix domain-containing protein [Streptomyces sp. NPDC090442]|uniref:TetR/AcrR family transcriptional regulator n=1 Tax=Streptomyces sp. NPDC090442 TaxID=3365962 RepID=UPI00380158BF